MFTMTDAVLLAPEAGTQSMVKVVWAVMLVAWYGEFTEKLPLASAGPLASVFPKESFTVQELMSVPLQVISEKLP